METLFGISMDIIMAVTLSLSLVVLAVVGILAWRRPILLRLALRNIPRRRAQTVLILFGLMLATLLITAAFGTGDTMTYSMRQAFTAGLGGTDITIKLPSRVPEFNGAQQPSRRPVPTFAETQYATLKAQAGADARIDGWSARLEQMAPLINPATRQASGQTTLTGLGSDAQDTLGDLHPLKGGIFALPTLQPGEIVLDAAAADKLAAQVGGTVRVVVAGTPHELRVREIVQNGSPVSLFPVAYLTLADMQALFNTPGQISEIDVSLAPAGGDGLANSVAVAEKLRGIAGAGYAVAEEKKTNLELANTFGNLFTSIFVGTALFSIAAGILLIFLVFAMLAAERKSEMGMARAVGTQRGHLTQMFVFEGLAYDLGAAAIGAALGVAVGFAMVGIISGLIGTFGFRLLPHIEVRSVIVAYCLGMLVTFFTVVISAARVSRLNIVAAIRDIPDLPQPGKKLLARVVDPFDQLFNEGRPLGCIGAVFSLIGSLLWSGPVTGGLGVLLLAAGWGIKNGFLFHTGASLTLIAIGLTLRWLLGLRRVRPATRDRIAFSFAGIGLLIYWALPIDALQRWFGVPEFGAGIELFFVGGLMMVAGAVWTIIYNADILLGVLTVLLGGVGHLRPILKTAVAYPMASIFRTGMALAMFALILFVLIVMSVLTQLNAQFDPAKPEATGNYQIQAPASYANPIPDIRARIAADPALKGKFTAIAEETTLPLQLRQPGSPPLAEPPSAAALRNNPGLLEGWRFHAVRLVDQAFLQDNAFRLMVRAKGYDTDRAVWDAMVKDPTLVVIDSTPVFIGQTTSFTGGTTAFALTGIQTSQPTMDPVSIEWRMPPTPGQPSSLTGKLTIIGVLNTDANFYPGLYLAREIVARTVPIPIPVSTYFFRVPPGADPGELRRALGASFLDNGLEPVVIADELRQQLAVGNGLNGLLQGFMTLGLLVGIAALGVISTRAVVERRQQIGVLRAIGYQPGMVATSFLLESSFIALLGIAIGVGLGLLLSYNLVSFLAKNEPTLHFDVPWLQIAGIVLIAYLASLVTTILPARQASRIYPAEALRYE